jgi:hypothetical protein
LSNSGIIFVLKLQPCITVKLTIRPQQDPTHLIMPYRGITACLPLIVNHGYPIAHNVVEITLVDKKHPTYGVEIARTIYLARQVANVIMWYKSNPRYIQQ